MFKFLCFPSVMVLVPSFSPLQDSARFLAFHNILPVSSLFLSLMPPLRPFLCIQTTQSSVCSPIVHPSESYQHSGWRPTNVLSWFPVQRPICSFAPPPPTCVAGGTWLGCGWGVEGYGAPHDGLASLDASAGAARVSVPSSMLDFPLWLLRYPYICLPSPPLLLSLYNRMCPYILPPNGRFFSWSLCAPLPRWTRLSCRLHSRLRAPFVSSPPPPPYSVAIISGSCSPLMGQVLVFDGLWRPHATGVGTGHVTARAKRGTITSLIYLSFKKYSTMTECHVLFFKNCVWLHYITCTTKRYWYYFLWYSCVLDEILNTLSRLLI